MKRYLAFYGACYYPCPAMDDFLGDFKSIAEAKEAIEKEQLRERPNDNTWEYDWARVFDTTTREYVYEK